jgi:hypothetical protein
MPKAFRPDIRPASELSPQGKLEDKFGGKPWGFPVDAWPKCKDCGESMSFLCQVEHNAERCDLGKDGRVMYLFMCNHNPGMCETWDQDSGANAVVIVEKDKLTVGLTQPPTAADEEQEFRVLDYVATDDDEVWDTHLAGTPMFVQGEDEAPGEPYRYVMHFSDRHTFINEELGAVEGPNFGSAGCGYVYVNTSGSTPTGKFFWQCG